MTMQINLLFTWFINFNMDYGCSYWSFNQKLSAVVTDNQSIMKDVAYSKFFPPFVKIWTHVLCVKSWSPNGVITASHCFHIYSMRKRWLKMFTIFHVVAALYIYYKKNRLLTNREVFSKTTRFYYYFFFTYNKVYYLFTHSWTLYVTLSGCVFIWNCIQFYTDRFPSSFKIIFIDNDNLIFSNYAFNSGWNNLIKQIENGRREFFFDYFLFRNNYFCSLLVHMQFFLNNII